MARIGGRIAALEEGRATPPDWTVPGTHELLDNLRRRGLKLYLASGTDVAFVKKEAALLGLQEFFGAHIYGALDDYQNFSKKMIVERILRENDLHGEELLGFGDGFVEIEEIKRAGGVAVAVASDEVKRSGINVSPAEVEEVLQQHPSVALAGVTGLSDPSKGELIVAYLTAKPGASIDPEAVVEHCRRHLSRYKVPDRVHVCEALPLTATGKLMRRELRTMAASAGAT